MNIFERAIRRKLRFSTNRGDLTTEQLFDLPLISNDSFDLDNVARDISRELRDINEGSFVNAKPDPRKTELELQLEIVKHAIESKQADIAAAEKRQATVEKRRRLVDALAAKEGEELAGKSREELLKELEELDG